MPPWLGSMMDDCQTSLSLPFRLVILIVEGYSFVMLISQAGILAGLVCFDGFIIINEFLKTAMGYGDNVRELLRSIRVLQLSVTRFNAFNQRVILPAIMIVVIGIITKTVLFLTVAGPEAPVVLILLNLLLLSSCTLMEVFGFGMAGKVHEHSLQLIESIKRSPEYARSKLLRLRLKSYPVLSIKFGLTSFMEKSTCLALMDFTIMQTVNLLLARNSN
jgi:hypothetical protein